MRGDSTIEAGICDGEDVLTPVRRVPTAWQGVIVVAIHLVSEAGERGVTTRKRLQFDHQRNCVLLRPANAALLRPIRIPMQIWKRAWEVQGTVAAIYRL